MPLPDEMPIEPGQLFQLPNLLTAFAEGKDDDEYRWAVVVATAGWVSPWLLPRTASGEDGLAVPAEAASVFTKDGVVFFKARQVRPEMLRGYRYGGFLEEPWRSDVLTFYADRCREHDEAREAAYQQRRAEQERRQPSKGRRTRGRRRRR